MGRRGLPILIVEDDYFIAQDIAKAVRAHGDQVVGPFPDVDLALQHLGEARAAILDIRVGERTSFAIADLLARHGTPFIFYSGISRARLPPHLNHARYVSKPCRPTTLIDLLHRMDARPAGTDTDIEDLLPLLRLRARQLLMDEQASDRLVEATLMRAVASLEERSFPPDTAKWLLDLLAREHRRHPGRHLS
ncbi:hypothetical protein [Wenxinia saemankumensis]|uniref:Response regulator receiver protein n=1 Tax=Wenxinia saemankumensis TaxID=1447782 RepID=A0A1M6HTX9_9RHOB|nr:hypothetical protein [Wenxinia saemankumensis]SHJ25655.1 response regulator receiver protein [Wenxinia saemankumensis]